MRRVLAASLSSFIGPLQEGESAPAIVESFDTGSVPAEHACLPVAAASFSASAGAAEEDGVPVINEFVNNHTGTDTEAFVEFFVPGVTAATDLSAYTLIEVEGEASNATPALNGAIDSFTVLGTTDTAGYYSVNINAEDSSMTWLLVTGFTGAVGDDIDTNDDGTIDNAPWTAIIDSVSVVDDPDEFGYSPAQLTPSSDGNFFGFGGASRAADGVDTDSANDWVRNSFNGAGFAAFPDADPAEGEALNTPGQPNAFEPFTAPAVQVLQPFGSTTVNEDGETSDTFAVRLATDPSSDVTVTLALNNGESTVDLTTLTFTTGAGATPWNVPQTVTVTAVDDIASEGVHTTNISFTVANAGVYGGIAVDDLVVTVLDDDGSSGVDPGDLVINEIMQNPTAAPDPDGEYFELWNVTDADIDINGFTISDDDNDSHLIDNGGPLIVPANGFLILSENGNTVDNGGLNSGYEYSGIILSNSSDELIISDSFSVVIDRVAWDNGATFPDPSGASMELIPGLVDPANANDDGANWQTGTESYGAGDLGTPGAVNSSIVILPGVTIEQTDGSTEVAEQDTTTDTITVVLDAEPTADVTITLTTADGETTVDTPTLTFTMTGGATPWDQPQTVTITAVDDTDLEANHTGLISFAVSSTDAGYAALTLDDWIVSITDNDGSSGLSPGDLVINEIMQNPTNDPGPGDGDGEYFELWNTTNADIDIEGFVISDADNDSHTIANGAPVIVPANGFAVLAVNADQLANGGFVAAYQYTGFNLSNGEDEVIISDNFGLEIDRVEYDNGATFPDTEGVAMELIPGIADPGVANDAGGNWQLATNVFGSGDFGTPGAANTPAATLPPTVESVTVNDGTDSRSQVTSVTVVFDSIIDATAVQGAFTITNVTTGEAVPELTIVATDLDGQTSVEITFPEGTSVDTRMGVGVLSNSLSDGNYRLDILASAVQSSGVAMATDFVFGGDEAVRPGADADLFFRFYGDSDGDRDVDGQDYGRFGLTFLREDGDTGYNPTFDSDGDGDVDGQDYGRFGLRFLTEL